MISDSVAPMLLEVSIRTVRTYILYAAFVIAIVLAVACIVSIMKQAKNRKELRRNTPQVKAPICPLCGSKMVLREYNSGEKKGRQYWECTNFMNCTGTLDYVPDEKGSDSIETTADA